MTPTRESDFVLRTNGLDVAGLAGFKYYNRIPRIMREAVLDKMSLTDLVRCIILLKPGKQNFLDSDLKQAISKASAVYPRLGIISDKTLDSLFFFDSLVLSGELNLPHYRLSESGRIKYKRWLQAEYHPDVLDYLRPVADEAWKAKQL